jgi:hypothetical protein
MARRDGIDEIHHGIHAEVFELRRFFAEGIEIVPRIGRTCQVDAVFHHCLNQQLPNTFGNELKTAV